MLAFHPGCSVFFRMNFYHHHHLVPSWRGLEAMVRHSSRSCARLTASSYGRPVHLHTFDVHLALGLPRPFVPQTFPSSIDRCNDSCLMMCPKYFSFFIWIFLISLSWLFTILITSSCLLPSSIIFIVFLSNISWSFAFGFINLHKLRWSTT